MSDGFVNVPKAYEDAERLARETYNTLAGPLLGGPLQPQWDQQSRGFRTHCTLMVLAGVIGDSSETFRYMSWRSRKDVDKQKREGE